MTVMKHVANTPMKLIVESILILTPSLALACNPATPTSLQILMGQSATFTVMCDAVCTAQVDAATGDTRIATVSPESQLIGNAPETFTVTGVAEGSTSATVNWSCAAYGMGSYSVSITIDQAQGLSSGTSGGNKPTAASVKDPISTFSGELYKQFAADIDLGGPMSLSFSRYYGSGLESDGILAGTLGNNWRHNFDWFLNNTGTGVDILSSNGALIQFSDSAGNWQQSGNTGIKYQLVEDGGTGEFTLLNVKRKRYYLFSTTGLLTDIYDGRGNQHDLTYNGSNQLTQVTDGIGRTLTFAYSENKLSMVSDGTRTASFSYNNDNLVGSTSVDGYTSTYVYAVNGLMSSYIKPAGNSVISQVFDGSGKVTSQTDGEGNTTTINYGLNNVTTVTDSAATVIKHTHAATGELKTFEDGSGGIVSIGSTADGLRNSITDRLGDVTTMTYHAVSARFGSITNTETNTTSFAYTDRTESGLTSYDLANITFADGSTKSMTYDSSGNLTSVTDRLGNITSHTYNNRGQILTTLFPTGGSSTNTYDGNGTLATTTDPAGNVVSFSYDTLLRPAQSTFSGGATESYTFDNANHLLTTTNENGDTASYTYDSNGNLSSFTTPLNEKVSFSYNGNDQLVTVTNPLAGTTTTAYDSTGQVLTFTDEIGNVTIHAYDELSRLISVTDPLGGIWKTSYDAEGRIASRTNPLGNTTSYNTDVMGRTTGITTALGLSSVFSYDEMGLLNTSSDPLGRLTTFNRNASGNISGIIVNDVSMSITYERNEFGQLTSITDPNGNDWERAYDSGGRLISSTDPLSRSQTISYDGRNRISEISYPEGLGTLTLAKLLKMGLLEKRKKN